jgi:hypothetical protein
VNRRTAMADPDSNDSAAAPPRPLGPICRHLRSNSMYISDGRPDGIEDDDYEPSACWCVLTSKAIGPDDDLVGRRACRDSGRTCYQPL